MERFRNLIEHLKKMPGIGPKSAQRLAFYFLNTPSSEISSFLKSIIEFKKNIRFCKICFNLAEGKDLCNVCSDSSRDRAMICVVEEIKDLLAIERSGSYKGLYHVLGGAISPLDGISPEKLKIKQLLERFKNGTKEIILAMNPTPEGEITALYLAKAVKPLDMKLTRLAYGLPAGADMDYVDSLTLTRALQGRGEMN
jgi:recombination protein RecR